MIKKSLVAVAAASAVLFGAGASAAPVVFDTHTSAGVISFNNMVWQAGNALVVSALSTPVTIDTNGDGVPDAQLLHTVAQARLASFTLAGSGSPLSLAKPFEITYQADFWEIATGIGGTTAGFTLATGLGLSNTVKFYFDSNAATYGDDTSGKNYGNGTLIASGDITSVTGNYTDFTRLGAALGGTNPFPVKALDCDAVGSGCVGYDGIDQTPGTKTNQGNGNNQILVDVTYQDSAYFKSDVSSLKLDLAQTVGIGVPFNNGNPWSEIVGQTPFFSLVGGSRVNGADCTIGGQSQAGVRAARCDQLLQTTGLTTFTTHVPEPNSIALVGLALAAAGFVARRRSTQG